jgi:hypothetical protein
LRYINFTSNFLLKVDHYLPLNFKALVPRMVSFAFAILHSCFESTKGEVMLAVSNLIINAKDFRETLALHIESGCIEVHQRDYYSGKYHWYSC